MSYNPNFNTSIIGLSYNSIKLHIVEHVQKDIKGNTVYIISFVNDFGFIFAKVKTKYDPKTVL
ncbi:hypothetical protein RVBP17_3140 [Pseudomonas phage sp. 30-3]|uniref:Uncharacterized protein n=1 Tax=Pseudomonas phage vB_PaeM_PA5oct TaxID=2163605 RepID=A0A4Y5JUL3_9CAUD|nr:hypothetical protein PQE65_gp071 [Pseudomonas phage vB_PaeM_PA5oct]WMI31949.1 hypothetical protein GBBBJNDB_00258 [Pseudomonas phage Callisto]WPK38900.1 hypothetical protein Cassandra_0224 [Pseudomonas phage Cassandra]WPK39420.1 hypothetical protein Deiofobo_0223 [Pseudomonas phage Deifobo]WPK39933.1 hypothetical protein ETTORE_0224 [Pseudomonas phage Ettore]WPK40453.1 hypothetical protein Paride_0223 [Pseudomonas phage Paride]VOH55165.1 hypothetical protein MIJ3_00257 [Pseudomonas phage v